MLKGTENGPIETARVSPETPLPTNILYATSARIGGSGLASVAFESLHGASNAGILGRAITFGNRARQIPARSVLSLHRHPVRLLSLLPRDLYHGAKKHCVDRVAARQLATGRYDLFHGWSGEAVRSLREARRRGIPSVLEIPTWHRNKGKQKPAKTRSERERDQAGFPKNYLNRLLVTRQQVMEEYDLADLLLVLSDRAIETFLAAGIPRTKLFKLSRGVDVDRFQPAADPPSIFRAVFVGSLIKRKGVHHLLTAWHRLRLKNAELVLVGSLHDEMRPFLEQFAGENIRVAGFSPRIEDYYRQATVHVLPSLCEGSAKTTYEAAACGLAQITTRESGDVVIDGVNGIIVPPDNPEALGAALEKLYLDVALRAEMGRAARERVVAEFTWDHFRLRLLEAYRAALACHPGR